MSKPYISKARLLELAAKKRQEFLEKAQEQTKAAEEAKKSQE